MTPLEQAFLADQNVDSDFRRALSAVQREDKPLHSGVLISFRGRNREAVEDAARKCREVMEATGSVSVAMGIVRQPHGDWMVLLRTEA